MCCELKRRKGERGEGEPAELKGKRGRRERGEGSKGPAPSSGGGRAEGRINAVRRCIYPLRSPLLCPALLSGRIFCFEAAPKIGFKDRGADGDGRGGCFLPSFSFRSCQGEAVILCKTRPMSVKHTRFRAHSACFWSQENSCRSPCGQEKRAENSLPASSVRKK